MTSPTTSQQIAADVYEKLYALAKEHGTLVLQRALSRVTNDIEEEYMEDARRQMNESGAQAAKRRR